MHSHPEQELLAPTARDLMRTLGDFVWHAPPPPPLATSDAVSATSTDADVKAAARGEEDAGADEGGRGLCVSSLSLCGGGGEWAWGDDAVTMARLPLHGIGVALSEQRCQPEEVRLRLPSRLLDLAGELSARLLPSGAEAVKWSHPVDLCVEPVQLWLEWG